MKSRTFMIWTLCLLACAAVVHGAPPPVQVLDAGKGYSPATPDKGDTRSVERGAEGAVFRGRPVVGNGRVSVMVDGPALRLFAVAPDGKAHHEADLHLKHEDGKPLGALETVVLESFGRGGAVVKLGYKRGEATLSVRRGESLVHLEPGPGAHALGMSGPIRWCMLPAFLGDDILFVPGGHKPGRHFLPSENLLLFFMQQEGALVQAIWPPGDQLVEMVVAGGEGERRLAAALIQFDGKPLHLAAWHRPGLWTTGNVGDRFGSRDGKLKDVTLDWRPPFPAQWKTVFHSRGRDTSWDRQPNRRHGTIGAHGGRSIDYICPFYAKGRQTILRLPPKGIHPEEPELYVTFALRRSKGTPTGVQLPEDILRMSLNTGVCEYLLDRQGMGTLGRPGGPLCVLDRRFGILARLYENKPIPSQLLQVEVDWMLEQGVQQVGRTRQYIAFAGDVLEAVGKHKGHSASLDEALDSIMKKARDIDTLARDIPVKMLARREGFTGWVPEGDDPVEVMETIADRLRKALAHPHPQNVAEWEDLEGKLHKIAVAPQTLLPDPRRLTRLVQYEAGRLAEHGPEGVRASRDIRKLATKMLRGKHWAEMGR